MCKPLLLNAANSIPRTKSVADGSSYRSDILKHKDGPQGPASEQGETAHPLQAVPGLSCSARRGSNTVAAALQRQNEQKPK
eukprot:4533900-Pleurochrysis_carterae.AAC.2